MDDDKKDNATKGRFGEHLGKKTDNEQDAEILKALQDSIENIAKKHGLTSEVKLEDTLDGVGVDEENLKDEVDILEAGSDSEIKPNPDVPAAGWMFIGTDEQLAHTKEKFWFATCPCGKTVTIPVNNFPTETTPFPCSNPKHFLVVWENEIPEAFKAAQIASAVPADYDPETDRNLN